MEVGWCPEVTGSARVAHGQGAHRAAELAAATASLRRQQSKLLPRTQMPDSVTESTSGCIAGSDMPEAQPPMQHSSWLLWRKNDGVEQHAHRAARHERGRGRGAWPVRGAGNERRSVRKRTPLHGARETGRRRGAYDARRARVSSSRPSHVTKSVRTSSTLIFVLACGLRIVVRLGLVPLLRRKKAADGRARREPRRPTPTPMQSAREAPTGTKRRSCEREGVESAPTREELRKKKMTSSTACRSEAERRARPAPRHGAGEDGRAHADGGARRSLYAEPSSLEMLSAGLRAPKGCEEPRGPPNTKRRAMR